MGSRDGELPEVGGEENLLDLPDMMFADGEEPVGVRVLTYQSSRAMNNILAALKEEEIQYLRASSFGRLVDIAEKPAFSGRFARFLLSRQLKVERKHEAWFRFAGQPIRFSLREFAIVTGLPCGELPEKPKGKKRRNIANKPYWPELFGSVEDMTVTRALKMLRKNTVTDRHVRMKLACLAIVSSVLLSTNLKMKMIKEHAELLRDIDEFLAFPWGRLAFDMLMTSIKKRDEVSLSQNTIALKGFALALQLVIVESVPALTEVVQEAFSSSESDTQEEESDVVSGRMKKKTLSPAHAREVDKREEVLVRCIIPQDPFCPIDETVLGWSDEVVDVRVEKMVTLISRHYIFRKDMFRGGVTKRDVERMREKPREQSRKRAASNKSKASTSFSKASSSSVDESKIVELVTGIMKPEIERLDGSVAAALSSLEVVASSSKSYQDNVVFSVERMLKAFKEEIMTYIKNSGELVGGNGIPETAPPEMSAKSTVPASHGIHPEGDNDEILQNIMENISHYSTPPGSGDVNVVCDGISRTPYPEVCSATARVEEKNGVPAFSSHSQTNENNDVEAFPTFDLGLSQEPLRRVSLADDDMDEIVQGQTLDQVANPVACRKSKRLKLVPTPLVNEYQCEVAILNRARQAKMRGSNYYELDVVEEKFGRLTKLLQKPCVINVAGLAVTAKDITDIATRSRPMPGKVFDILIRLVISTFYNHGHTGGETRTEFLDSRFVGLLTRNYDRFKRQKLKETYSFPKGLVDCLVKSCSSGNVATRFYLPLHVEKKHWIGFCVDFTKSKIHILDCIAAVLSDAELSRHLLPISDMFPYLLKHCGLIDAPPTAPFSTDRVKGVVQNSNAADSALTAALLMQAHALFGADTCRCLSPDVLGEEAHRAAVMIYEFHAKL